MLLIKPRLTDSVYDNDGYNRILDGIDAKIAELGKQQFYNHAYGVGEGADLTLMRKLAIYREILLRKLMGCNCFEDDHIVNIISRIQKLIN